MESPFDRALAHVLGIEGGYSDHKADRGGKTMLGVTEGTLQRAVRAGVVPAGTRIEELTAEQAAAIYRALYWNAIRGDDVAAVSVPVAIEMFDTAVNMAPSWAGRFLQRALNAFNRNAADWPDIKVDGQVGPATLGALRAMANKRGATGMTVLLRALNAQQGERYLTITEANPSQEAFTYGWFLNRVEIPA